MSLLSTDVSHPRVAFAFVGLLFLLSPPVKPSQLMADEALPNKIAGKQLVIVRDDQKVTVTNGDRLLFQYRYGAVSHKPYVVRLTSPTGVNVLRDAPADHLHHHGLMFAWHVNGVNFWEELSDSGRQVHAGWRQLRVADLLASDARPVEVAMLREQLQWETSDGVLLLKEERLLTVPAGELHDPTCFVWQSTFTAPRELSGVTITGTNYSGLGARFLKAMDEGGSFCNAMNARGVEATNASRASWCAYTARANPQAPVTVTMFDATRNIRHPATWFTMDRPFAYLAATLGLDKDPVKITADQPLTLTYGVAVFDGDVDRGAINDARARWQELVSAQGNDEVSSSNSGQDD